MARAVAKGFALRFGCRRGQLLHWRRILNRGPNQRANPTDQRPPEQEVQDSDGSQVSLLPVPGYQVGKEVEGNTSKKSDDRNNGSHMTKEGARIAKNTSTDLERMMAGAGK